MEEVKNKTRKSLFYFLLFWVIIRPSLDILSQKEIKISTPFLNFNFNVNIFLGSWIFLIGFLFLIRNLKVLQSTALFYPIILFLSLSFASIFYSLDSSVSLREFIRIAGIFLLYFLVYQLMENKKDWFLLLKIILVSYFLPAVFAVFQLISGRGLVDEFGGFYRIYGTFAHPNPFAFYAFFIFGLVFSLLLTKDKELKLWFKEKDGKIILGISAVILTFLILATYSRSALACFFGFIFIFGIFKYRKLLLAGFSLFLVIYFSSPVFQERIWELITLDPYGSVVWRLRFWRDMIPLFFWHPWFGYGLGVFTKLAEFYRGFKFGSLEAHNDFLKILLENGILGLLAYFWIIIGLLLCLFKIFINSQNSQKIFSLGLLGISMALFGASFFDNILRVTALQWSFWVLMAGWLKINQIKSG
ncbi:MAG: hypothetical protein A3E90_01035 [Candidatus Portnoybacteria bacterium RIFCSPHIGHO2_12_FULL_40_11]|uniref:O-antigen ligase-related domain-containing protein n=1 Tax=Candidatus Portnoybacteria bacterium RIFCSPHIGHO2_12_FULL_40_11 TaxID=1801998 RepID=A0A1G2FI53_9BACT|nr:MAG: hypothetical protein A3E90_01035 [Candidatus Portnoybacteria bacterium RIFCSPHIGHO2_12_FULL_40_11]